jgi:hypothetical protein
MSLQEYLRPALALCAGALLLAGAPARADYPSEILSDSPVVYYRFDDNVATGDLDWATNYGSLGAAGNAFGQTNYSRHVAGAIPGSTNNYAVSFINSTWSSSPSRGHFSVPCRPELNPSHLGNNPFTVECWAKPNRLIGGYSCPVSSMSKLNNGRAGYLIYLTSTGWQARLGSSSSTAPVTVLSGGTPVSNVWQQVAFTYSGGPSGTLTLFVNGVQVGVTTVTNYEANTLQSFNIGADGTPGYTFDGAVDEVAFYSSALSAERLQSHHDMAASNPAGYFTNVLADAPVGYWTLAENLWTERAYPTARNEGWLGSFGDGAYTKGADSTAAGPGAAQGFYGFGTRNPALSLGSGYGCVSTTNSPLNNLTQFTVTGWVRRPGLHASATGSGLFGQSDVVQFLDYTGGTSDGGMKLQVYYPVAGGGSLLTPALVPPSGQWEFVAATGDGKTNAFYLNGVLQAKKTGSLTYSKGTSPFNIGGGVSGTVGDWFRGDIDEVAVFDRALSADRIAQLYAAALGTPPPQPPTLDSWGPLNGGAFPLSFSGPSGRTYELRTTSDLTLPVSSWTLLATGVFGDSPVTYTDMSATNTQQFYRVVLP